MLTRDKKSSKFFSDTGTAHLKFACQGTARHKLTYFSFIERGRSRLNMTSETGLGILKIDIKSGFNLIRFLKRFSLLCCQHPGLIILTTSAYYQLEHICRHIKSYFQYRVHNDVPTKNFAKSEKPTNCRLLLQCELASRFDFYFHKRV